ncbi:MAG: HEAT repeat domain-containing protein [Verrucomicrobia bacterium]|nr:HEAT repeat domain-containing protein [Verrucomicrobiota bacterium]
MGFVGAKGATLLQEMEQARAMLIGQDAQAQAESSFWFRTQLDKSTNANTTARFLIESYPIITTNAINLLYTTHNLTNSDLKTYSRKLYADAVKNFRTNDWETFESCANIFFRFDPTNAARFFAKDIHRVPFFNYHPKAYWSARETGRATRGSLAWLIGESGDETAIATLVALLDSPEEDWRRIGAFGLMRTDDARYIAPLKAHRATETSARVREDLQSAIVACSANILRKRAEKLNPLGRPVDLSQETHERMRQPHTTVDRQIMRWLVEGDEETRILAAHASRSVDDRERHLRLMLEYTAREPSPRVRLALQESAVWDAEEVLDRLGHVKPSEFGRRERWRLDEVKAITELPLASEELKDRARALLKLWEAEPGK